jgi:NADH-quinone oxidoreductase subunit J
VQVIAQRGGLAVHAGGGPDGSARAMGKSIFEEWLLPFEVVSLLLTGAIFGCVVLTKRRLA